MYLAHNINVSFEYNINVRFEQFNSLLSCAFSLPTCARAHTLQPKP